MNQDQAVRAALVTAALAAFSFMLLEISKNNRHRYESVLTIQSVSKQAADFEQRLRKLEGQRHETVMDMDDSHTTSDYRVRPTKEE